MEAHEEFFELAAQQARQAKCYRASCGSVIISRDGEVIGRGYNAPPLERESQRYCEEDLDLGIKPKSDKTCCVHAEWNAIFDACKFAPDLLEGATLYFMRTDENDYFTDAGEPYCTVCSRLALQSGIDFFALWNRGGVEIYDTSEYNTLSYNYYQ